MKNNIAISVDDIMSTKELDRQMDCTSDKT